MEVWLCDPFKSNIYPIFYVVHQGYLKRTVIMSSHPHLNLSAKSVKRKRDWRMWNWAAIFINHLLTLTCVSHLWLLWCSFLSRLFQPKQGKPLEVSAVLSATQLCLFWNKSKTSSSDALFIFPLLPSPPHNEKSREEEFLDNQSAGCSREY